MKSNSFFHYLTQKNKLTFRNIRTGEEYWHIFVNRLHMIGAVLGILALVFASVLAIVAYTPILDLVPGNPGGKQREMLIAGIEKLDSLEREVGKWQLYNDNLMTILEGGVPQVANLEQVKRDSSKTALVGKVDLDSLLRLKHKGDSSRLVGNKSRSQRELTFEMLPPASGMIVMKFNPKANQMGITLTPPPSSMVTSVMDGTVVMENWSPQTGFVIAVQHASNLLSVYKQASKSLKKVGTHVKAGEPIAVSGEIDNGEIPKLIFELWQNGSPIDPENYIAF